MKGHINSGQSNDNEDEEDDHDSEVLISVKVASTDDDILVQYEELTSDEMFPHEDGERYTQHLYVSTKDVGQTIQKNNTI